MFLHSAEISEYKGKAVMTIKTDKTAPFAFGLSKAKQILDHLEEIKAFVRSEGQDCSPPTERLPAVPRRRIISMVSPQHHSSV